MGQHTCSVVLTARTPLKKEPQVTRIIVAREIQLNNDNSKNKDEQLKIKYNIQESVDPSQDSSYWSFLTVIALFACCALPILILSTSTLTISTSFFRKIDIWLLGVASILIVVIGYGIHLRKK